MEYLVEVELQHKGMQTYFEDWYTTEIIGIGTIIENCCNSNVPVDCMIVYLSKGDELIQIWELPTDRESLPTKLAEVMEQLTRKIRKGGKHEDKRTHSNSSHSDSAVREPAT